MCGICGIAGYGIQPEDIKVFKDLLYVSALRGDHSTGVAAIRTDSDSKRERIRIKKEPVAADYFLFSDDNDKHPIMADVTTSIFMGHCRYATAGKVTKENSHPFDVGQIVGTHNGTLDDKEFRHLDLTDSEMMFTKMQDAGIVKTLDGLLPESAFAVSIYQKTSETLLLGRNEHRPLYVALHRTRPVLYYASEIGMLDLALKRETRNIKYRSYALEAYKLYNFSMDWITSSVLFEDDELTFEYDQLEDKTGQSANWWESYQYSYPQHESPKKNETFMLELNKGDTRDYHCDFCGCEVSGQDLQDSDEYFGRMNDFTSVVCPDCIRALSHANGVSVN